MHELTIVCISDTHGLHREVDVPPGDILIHAGDFTMFSKSAAAIMDFNKWLGELPHHHKIVVPGNHEFFLEADPAKRRLLSNATVLIDEGIEIMGLKIWGSPITPLYGGAFGRSSPADRTRLYATIPDVVDILVTHGPPYGVLDRSPGMLQHSGCPELREAVAKLKPQLHLFGHVHGAHGMTSIGDTLFVNAAQLGPDGGIDCSPIALRMPRARLLHEDLYAGLTDLNTGFDSTSISHLSAADFLILIDRCESLGVGIIGIEVFSTDVKPPWKAELLEVAISPEEEYEWARHLMRKYRGKPHLTISATFNVPNQTLLRSAISRLS